MGCREYFLLKCKYIRISKFVYHYEIYKKIIDIPGDILEFGVFKGASFSKLLAFRKILEIRIVEKLLVLMILDLLPLKEQRKTNSLRGIILKTLVKELVKKF